MCSLDKNVSFEQNWGRRLGQWRQADATLCIWNFYWPTPQETSSSHTKIIIILLFRYIPGMWRSTRPFTFWAGAVNISDGRPILNRSVWFHTIYNSSHRFGKNHHCQCFSTPIPQHVSPTTEYTFIYLVKFAWEISCRVHLAFSIVHYNFSSTVITTDF